MSHRPSLLALALCAALGLGSGVVADGVLAPQPGALLPTSVGAPPPAQPFGLGVGGFKARLKKSETRNKLLIVSDVNLPEGAVDPQTDTLSIFVGGILDYVYAPDELKQVGPSRYRFKDKFTGRRGSVQLFRKGTSRGRFRLFDKGFLAAGVGGLGPLEALDVRFVWGAMDEQVTLAPVVNGKGTRARFRDRKQTYASVELWLRSASVSLDTKAPGNDRLHLRAKLAGGEEGSFAPLVDDTTLAFGPFALVVPAGEWELSGQGTKLRWTSADAAVVVRFDSVREELTLVAKSQDLAGFASTAQLLVQAGAYAELREVVLAANTSGSSFRY